MLGDILSGITELSVKSVGGLMKLIMKYVSSMSIAEIFLVAIIIIFLIGYFHVKNKIKEYNKTVRRGF